MDKWFAIMIVGVVVGMFTPLAVLEHAKGQCKVTAIHEHMPSEDIAKICK